MPQAFDSSLDLNPYNLQARPYLELPGAEP